MGGAGDASAGPDRERPPDGAAHGAAAGRDRGGGRGRPPASREPARTEQAALGRGAGPLPHATHPSSPRSSSRASSSSSGPWASLAAVRLPGGRGSPTRRSPRRRPPPAPPAGWRSPRSGWPTASPACAPSPGWTGRSSSRRQSRLDAALREDPSGFYSRMTFATRDWYRHVVERIARRTRRSEESVARRAVECARAALASDPANARRAHVGYYLIDDGLAELERVTGYHPRGRRGGRIAGYAGIPTRCSSAAWSRPPPRRSPRCSWLGGDPARAAWIPLLLLGLIPANDIAVNVVNQLVTAFLPPRTLPKLDLHEHGVPAEFRTAVVIPTLFGSVDGGARGAGASRGPVPGEPRSAPALRRAERLHRFSDRAPRRRRRDRGGGGRGRARAQRPLRRGPRGRLLPLSPGPPLEPAGRRLDGMGAQARQALPVQPVRPGARARAPSPSWWATWSRSAGCATSSRSTTTPSCRPTPRPTWSARSRIRSTARSMVRRWAASCGDTGSSSRGWASPCPARTARSSRPSIRAGRGWIRTPPRCPTSIRTSMARAASPAKACTTWRRSSGRRADASRRTRCSPTTSSREATPAPASRPTWWSTTTIPVTTSPSPGGSIAGSAATGSCSPG